MKVQGKPVKYCDLKIQSVAYTCLLNECNAFPCVRTDQHLQFITFHCRQFPRSRLPTVLASFHLLPSIQSTNSARYVIRLNSGV